MKWGLVPHYSKFEDKNLNTTNARAENLAADGGMWASLKGPKRCAVVCQGYYEWLTKGKSKLPHFVKPKDGRLMLMAGLFDSVVLQGLFIFVFLLPNILNSQTVLRGFIGETETMWTFTIVTTAANPEFSWLHERQPVILHTPEALAAWLDTSSLKWSSDLVPLLAPTTCALDWYAPRCVYLFHTP
jgi:putative SOS response-associated peptidase YedK